MKQAGHLLMLAGAMLAVFGVAQFAWAQMTSTDADPSILGNGVLMALCFYAGIAIFGIGGWTAGRFRWPLV